MKIPREMENPKRTKRRGVKFGSIVSTMKESMSGGRDVLKATVPASTHIARPTLTKARVVPKRPNLRNLSMTIRRGFGIFERMSMGGASVSAFALAI